MTNTERPMSRKKGHKFASGHGRKRVAHGAYGRHTFHPQDSWHLLSFDGSCSENGRADATGGWGWRLTDPHGDLVDDGSGSARLKPVTCNTAEFEGLIAGLHGAGRATMVTLAGLVIQGDSDFVVRIMNGDWAAHDARYVSFRAEALDLIESLDLSWSARWVRREHNAECDDMSRAYLGGVK